uniref:Serine/threonine protein phosphatase n=1 Tax=uncultured myxobacterium HF0070_11L13 TaxID=723554 RepID=E7C211_9BACT|nr:serine/threonine protein phosphatase [uncultured myxobacterium HF0070_11L13]
MSRPLEATKFDSYPLSVKSISAALTDVGMKRPHNEDAYFHDDELQLYVVADGMGGHAAGEVASWEAVQAVNGMVKNGMDRLLSYRQNPCDETISGIRRLLESGIQAATYMVFAIAEQDPEHKGMGTTITAMLVIDDIAVVGSVGDSRAYLVRNNQTWQVTEDHTLVQLQVKAGLVTPEQAKHSPKGNVITRAVGPRDYVQVDTFVVPVEDKDRYLICSDGLHGYLETDEIAPIMEGQTLDVCCQKFIDLANERGGKDNITCVVAELGG